MATASLLVRVRTTGAAGLRELRRQFRVMSGEIERLQRRHLSGLGAQLGALARAAGRAANNGIDRLGAGINALGDAFGRNAAAMAKWPALILAVGSAIVPLTVTIGNLLPLLMVIPAAISGAVLAFTTLKFAFEGFGTAVGAGLSGDVEAFDKALRKLPKSTRDAARAAVEVAPAWRKVKKEVQSRFWQGAADDIRALSRVFAPLMETYLPKIADGFRAARQELVHFFTNDNVNLDFIFKHLTDGVNGLLRTISPLGMALADILEVAAPKFARLGEHIGNSAERFAAFIRHAKESGDLRDWLDRAVATFEQLKRIAGNLGDAFAAIFRGGQEQGQSFLTTLEELTRRMADWLNTERGRQFIELLGLIANALLSQLGVIGTLLDAYMAFANHMRQIWANILEIVLDAMLKMLQGATGAFGWIPVIGGKLEKAKKDFENFSAGVIAALRAIPDETIYVNVRYRDPGSPGRNVKVPNDYEAGIGGKATGGPVAAGSTWWVGERGPELVTFGQAGMVHTAAASRRMVSGQGAPAGGRLELSIAPGADSAVGSLIATLVQRGVIRLRVVGGAVTAG